MIKIKWIISFSFNLMAISLIYLSYKTRQELYQKVPSSKFMELNTSISSGQDMLHKEFLYVRKKDSEVCSQAQRQEGLSKLCEDYNTHKTTSQRGSERLINVLVDDINKVVYCPVQKAGCSTWKTIMANISSGGKIDSNLTARQLRGLHYYIEKYGIRKAVYDERLSNYTKFMIARHPMDRLVSAYWDKMRGGDVTFNKYAYTIAKQFRTNETNDNVFPTFEEFVRMIFANSPLSRNQHWDRYFFKCNPCYVQYDYILKIETMDQDMGMFLSQVYDAKDHKHVGNTKLNSLGDVLKDKQPLFSKQLDMYKDMSPDLLERLLTYFQLEHKFFGYSFDVNTFKTSCCHHKSTSTSVQECCC